MSRRDGCIDRDGLDDGTEVEGWNLTVVVNETGDPYKWAGDRDSGEDITNISITSNPRKVDSDNDGLTDATEKEEFDTDPNSAITYNVTHQHQSDLVDELADYGSDPVANQMARNLGLIQRGESVATLERTTLTDRTDDFDFVWTDGEVVTERVTFRALDHEQRTDTWFSNQAEYRHGTDLWDPDTDDDGLTDGQEVKWVTRYTDGSGVQKDPRVTYNTNATNPDSDGDGYWDGWVAVYDVNRTDNVVLYMENIWDDDEMDESEIVKKQIGVHEVNEVASAGGTDIDGDGAKEHSNLHIGELTWDNDPKEEEDVPDPDVSIEAHFWTGEPNQRLNNSGLVTGIEQNYALYGIDVSIIRDETIDPNDSTYVEGPKINGFEAEILEQQYEDGNEDQFLLVAPQAGFPGEPDAWGFATPGLDQIFLYYDPLKSQAQPYVQPDNVETTPYQNSISVVAGFTALHEVGHVLNIGAVDDDELKPLPFSEEYSGSPTDPTPEKIEKGDDQLEEWNVMRRGWSPSSLFEHNGTSYHVFSLEEMSTVEDDN